MVGVLPKVPVLIASGYRLSGQQRVGKIGIVRYLQDRAMKRIVGLAYCTRVFQGARRRKAFDSVGESQISGLDCRNAVPPIGRGQTARQRFKGDDDWIELFRLRSVQGSHACPASRLTFDQSLAFQMQERFTHWRATDAQRSGYLAVLHHFTGGKVAVNDPGAQALNHHLARALPPDLLDLSWNWHRLPFPDASTPKRSLGCLVK